MIRYTAEQVEYVRKNAKGRTTWQLRQMFIAVFRVVITDGQLKGLMARYGIKTGSDGRFKPGLVPHNKGKIGVGGWEPTQFKKGHLPANYKPVGSERIDANGYIWVKVDDPRTWRMKHVLLWERETQRKIPKGHVLIFGDGDKTNQTVDNLILVSRAELAMLNKLRLIQGRADLTKTGVLIADVRMAAHKRKPTTPAPAE